MNTTPRSGWLSKLSTSNKFGAPRWQSRYFILLDSELRYYKDEHSATASRSINLHDIARVVITSITNHPHTFRLEPTLYFEKQQQVKKQQPKVWTIKCHSEFELEAWVAAIDLQLSRLIYRHQRDIASSILQPFSTLESKRNQSSIPLARAFTTSSQSSSSSSGSSVHCNEEKMIVPQPRPLRRSKPSISRRRGVILSPLEMEKIPGLENDMLSSSSSRNSSLSSPIVETSKVISNETIIEELDEEEFQSETTGHANKVTVHDAYLLDASSPTFAFYKERIHL